MVIGWMKFSFVCGFETLFMCLLYDIIDIYFYDVISYLFFLTLLSFAIEYQIRFVYLTEIFGLLFVYFYNYGLLRGKII